MDGLALRHLENILYREDEMENRIDLLHRWTKDGKVDVHGFKRLIKFCDKEQLERDKKRLYGS